MSKAVKLKEVVRFIDLLLDVASESDREGNGLTVVAGGTVTKLGAALNTSFESIRRAGELGVDLLLVHHTSWETIDHHLKEEKFAQLRNLGISLCYRIPRCKGVRAAGCGGVWIELGSDSRKLSYMLSFGERTQKTRKVNDVSTSTKQADISLHYNISIEPALRRITVALKIKGAKEKLVLTMRESSGPQTDFLSNVKMLKVFDSQGHQIPIESEQNRWMVQSVSPEMTLSYLIQPKHDKLISWEPTLNDNYCLIFGYAVLIYPEMDLNQELFCKVELDVPQHWPDITTWGYQKRRYRASTLGDLIESIIALGDYRLYHSNLQGRKLTLAIRNQWPFSDGEFLSWTENYLKHHAEIFGGMPFDSLTVYCDKRQARGGLGTIVGHGEKKSVICALINPESETPNAMRLNHWMFSHELFHLWLGGAIQPQEPGLIWVQESMPCYYATLSVCQFLSDTEAESKNRKAKPSVSEANRFFESLREWHAKAKRVTGLSIKEAVSIFMEGDYERSEGVISNKGPLVCWILDVEIRVATGNRKCLADLMKILYQRFGNQPKAYSNDDVFTIASELGGQDYGWIYKKYVLGTEPIPFENYLTKSSVLSE